LVPRLSSIGWHAARAAASSFCKAASSTLLPIRAAAAGATSSGRGATAPNDTRAGRALAAAVERQAHTGAHHGDVHLRAGNKAQVGFAGARGLGRQQERGDDLALGQRQLARRQHHVLDRHLAPALGPTIDAFAPAAISAGTLSAAGEPLHRLPPMVARPCICVEPIRLAASTMPATRLELGCSFSSAPVTAAPIAEAAGLLLDLTQLGDALDVDQQTWLDHVGPHLHQAGRSRRQHARSRRFPAASSATAWSSDLGAS
jgi:hypothetical protein